MSILNLLEGLVESCLGKSVDDMIIVASDEEFEELLESKAQDIQVVWIGSEVSDPVFCLWKLAKENMLARKAHFIYTNIDVASPHWADLKDFEGGMFGSLYLVTYDAATNPGVKPSQRGIFMNMK